MAKLGFEPVSNPIQWVNEFKLRMEEEAQEGKGEDGEGKRNCGEHTNLLENEQKDPCPSY